jgi:tetratricopeptide (TPR) repeat protein
MKTFSLDRRVPDDELAMWIRRLARLLVVATVAFAAFYVIDRWRPASPQIVDQQVTALEAAVRADPNDISVRGQLADAYVAKGRFADAVSQYDAIIAAGVSLETAHFGRAAANLGLDRLDEAAADYLAVVDIAKGGEMANVDPTLEAAYYGLGSIAMRQNRPVDAIAFLEKALAINRADADALYVIGTAYAATSEADKAISVLRSAVALVPVGWSEPYAALAGVYASRGQSAMAAWANAMVDLMTGRSDAALPALEALIDGDAGVDAALGLGLLYETRGDNEAASGWFAKALQLDPDNIAAKLGASRVGPAASAGGAE